MVSMTVALEDSFKAELDSFAWVSWSEVGAERLLKRDIFEKFIKGIELSKEDEEFCERTGWDPLDEMEVRKEYIEKLKKLEKGHFKTAKRLEFWKE